MRIRAQCEIELDLSPAEAQELNLATQAEEDTCCVVERLLAARLPAGVAVHVDDSWDVAPSA